MWLLDVKTEDLRYFADEMKQEYAILSHTWAEEEVTFQDIQTRCAKQKKGYEKVRYTCEQAIKDGFAWVWIDTLCINKESSAELSEAINSMYQWYASASLCYVYLSDAHAAVDTYHAVDNGTTPHSVVIRVNGGDPRRRDPTRCFKDVVYSELGLHTCRWFQRGWTLQELIAPTNIDFYGPKWQFLGTKESLLGTLSAVTGIHKVVLEDRITIANFTAAAIMSWAAHRQTSRVEDRAYSLLGILDITMPLLYGEGLKAFLRLQEEILRQSNDLSVLGGRWESLEDYFLFASSPTDFEGCHDILHWDFGVDTSFQITNKGLEVRLPLIYDERYEEDRYDEPYANPDVYGVLNCWKPGHPVGPLALPLTRAIETLQGNLATFLVLPLHKKFFIPIEELESATATTITVLKDALLSPRVGCMYERPSSRPDLFWIHLLPRHLLSVEHFTDVTLHANSQTSFGAGQSCRVQLLGDELLFDSSEGNNIFEVLQKYPQDFFAFWSITRETTRESLIFGVAVRASSHQNAHIAILYHPFKDNPDGHTSTRFSTSNVRAILDQASKSAGLVARIPGWFDVVVKIEDVVRMAWRITEARISLHQLGEFQSHDKLCPLGVDVENLQDDSYMEERSEELSSMSEDSSESGSLDNEMVRVMTPLKLKMMTAPRSPTHTTAAHQEITHHSRELM